MGKASNRWEKSRALGGINRFYSKQRLYVTGYINAKKVTVIFKVTVTFF